MDIQTPYEAHVRPLLEYANQVVYSGCTDDDTLIESVQRAAARTVASHKSVDYVTRLAMLDLFSLEYICLGGDNNSGFAEAKIGFSHTSLPGAQVAEFEEDNCSNANPPSEPCILEKDDGRYQCVVCAMELIPRFYADYLNCRFVPPMIITLNMIMAVFHRVLIHIPSDIPTVRYAVLLGGMPFAEEPFARVMLDDTGKADGLSSATPSSKSSLEPVKPHCGIAPVDAGRHRKSRRLE
ncbi:hypothetical protein T265_09979 [Opisthorchis viverrini]|uniref:Uncharacterized protein n=1 Tax=Opisthorchis viverrini TaxID=6198 RepID=A0A074Z888_OPIVI|nr:hypothetical protein T265_09979 [Opisthorchis viverrini]KER21772.1 hypothetical protein T265_09979 [Opisthorchis viverrini]